MMSRFGPAVRRASGDVVDSRLMESQAHDDRSIEGGVGLSVAAPIEAVPASGHARTRPGWDTRRRAFAKAASERIRSRVCRRTGSTSRPFRVGADPEARTERR